MAFSPDNTNCATSISSASASHSEVSEVTLEETKKEKMDIEREARAAKRETGRLKRANKEETEK